MSLFAQATPPQTLKRTVFQEFTHASLGLEHFTMATKLAFADGPSFFALFEIFEGRTLMEMEFSIQKSLMKLATS